ncbi:RlpA-like double-psi beta-barrel-protein domain-containing protein-containing protein [Limtongia smithiae]|uniref:RlpA-like double-psi beta-barrel-protein domain-containing protein-containing protein n=1 Tax=Limtongia smithiae TaxID=1125753 RepID=UPI0034CD1DEA
MLFSALLSFVSLALAMPAPHNHNLHERDIAWVTVTEAVPFVETVTVVATVVVYATGTDEDNALPVSTTTYAAEAGTTSTSALVEQTSSSELPSLWFEAPSSTYEYVAPTTSTTSSVYVAPTTSTTSSYVVPTTSTTTSTSTSTTSSAYVKPTSTSVKATSTYVAPTTTSVSTAVSSTSSAAAATTTTSSSTTGEYSGDGTYFSPGLGSCGETNSDTDYIVAISYILMDEASTGNSNTNPYCNKKITAYRDGKSVSVTVVDTCEGCAEYDLDFSPAAFDVLGEESEGRIPITWSWDD